MIIINITTEKLSNFIGFFINKFYSISAYLN